jgi:hypothetical protein
VELEDNAEKGMRLFNEIRDAGCLQEENISGYTKIFAPNGLHEVLSLEKGCYLQELSSYYGFARMPCARCGLCLRPESESTCDETVVGGAMEKKRATPLNPYQKRKDIGEDHGDSNKKTRSDDANIILVSQEISNVLSKKKRDLHRKAKWVFNELFYRCLVCGKAGCNGEMCLKGCYRCGDRTHHTNSCSFNKEKLGRILKGKGVCFGCFDTRQHLMTHHDYRQCPLKKRLKRLFFLDRARREVRVDFEAYLLKLYASETTFVSVISSYSNDTTLGR